MSVAVEKNGQTWLKVGAEWQRASEEIMPLIATALSEAALEPKDLDAIALSIGPGSFTALRIGMSTAKGLCFALEKPLIAVGTLEAIAQTALVVLHTSTTSAESITHIVPVVYSKADEFFVGAIEKPVLQAHMLTELPKSYLTLTELIERFPKGSGAVVCGRSPEKWRRALLESVNWVEVDFSAQSLLPIAHAKWQEQHFMELASAEPLYLKNFEARVSTKKFFS